MRWISDIVMYKYSSKRKTESNIKSSVDESLVLFSIKIPKFTIMTSQPTSDQYRWFYYVTVDVSNSSICIKMF